MAQAELEGEGDADRIIASGYEEMRRIARRIIAGDALRAVLQPTDLVNEAVLRLIDSSRVALSSKGHLLALAARTMRRVLIDESRKAAAAKRQTPELLTSWPGAPSRGLLKLEDLHGGLQALEAFSPEHAQVVELRFSFGMSVEEAAAASGVAERTIKRRWQAARAWLHDYLSEDRESVR
jgi:RNA polymerase sigma factor (TIGR02999 family)